MYHNSIRRGDSPVLVPIARDTTVTQCHFFFQSLNAKSNKDYPQAKNYGKYSLTMTVLNIFFTLCLGLLITGLVVGCTGSSYYYNSTYSLVYAVKSNEIIETRASILILFYKFGTKYTILIICLSFANISHKCFKIWKFPTIRYMRWQLPETEDCSP